jgi:glutamate-ammonia-ligase adenylyltransferase
MAERVLQMDADLRPEGKSGAMVRSLDSYAEYYRRWSLIWEAQALLRARPMAGDDALAADFVALIDPIRYPDPHHQPEGPEYPDHRRLLLRQHLVQAQHLVARADPGAWGSLSRSPGNCRQQMFIQSGNHDAPGYHEA